MFDHKREPSGGSNSRLLAKRVENADGPATDEIKRLGPSGEQLTDDSEEDPSSTESNNGSESGEPTVKGSEDDEEDPSSTDSQASTPTSATPNPASSDSRNEVLELGSESGLSAGVVAGAAVGAAVGAAILTFLITFMLFRRKGRTGEEGGGSRKPRSGGSMLSAYTEKALSKDHLPKNGPAPPLPSWQKHLPQSADDNTIRKSVKTLFDQVELHVENFYHDLPEIEITERTQADLLKVDSPHLPESIVALLPRAKSQTTLIKHCLLSYIIASISTEDDSVPSLLPSDYATLPHLLGAAAVQNNKKGTKTPALDQAFSQWRVLSAYLRPSPNKDQNFLTHRDAIVHTTATILTTAFSPWSSPPIPPSSTNPATTTTTTTTTPAPRNPAYTTDQARLQNLSDILRSATDVGILIFSQPSTFAYHWTVPDGHHQHQHQRHPRRDDRDGSGGDGGNDVVFVTTPAFWKVTDENAFKLKRPQLIIQMTTSE